MNQHSDSAPADTAAKLYEVGVRVTQYRHAFVVVEAHSEAEACELACLEDVDDALLMDTDVEADHAQLLSEIVEEGDQGDE